MRSQAIAAAKDYLGRCLQQAYSFPGPLHALDQGEPARAADENVPAELRIEQVVADGFFERDVRDLVEDASLGRR